ncbi:hypothetical protein EZ449_16435 [Pedobacter frigidisoli]|uniref:Uncharacterized protein n=1 Tax=Pedobacter frigidisoli TaxID=2530455 RepID=A0A4R0NXT3_9SPHI|nr:hypothetical protein [Pedobacter frigidisoli]TCD04542.1 hypothetical protein EZ449_16435 [Pedobacter frigidisoli]
MKIFNVQPITVNEYIFNEEHVAESLNGNSYESGFGFECIIVDSVKTMIVTFEILISVGGIEWTDTIIPTDDPNKWSVQVNGMETDDGEILMSYKSSCQINLENEGFDADVLSLTDFLSKYNTHTQTFFNLYGFKSAQMERESLSRQALEENAIIAIENLRGNNMYEF